MSEKNAGGKSSKWTGIGIPLGLTFGALIGMMGDNLALGAGIGLIVGIVAGAALDARRSR